MAPAPAFSPWQEVTGTDGKVYYYNASTGQSTWDKPEELFSEVERALAQIHWREYTADGGVKYWYNTETKQSVWEVPPEVQAVLDHHQKKSFNHSNTGRRFHHQHQSGNYRDHSRSDHLRSNSNNDFSRKSGPFTTTVGSIAVESAEDAAANFREALRQLDLSKSESNDWNNVLHLLVTLPEYWAVKNPLDRKKLFDEHLVELKNQKYEHLRSLQEKLHAQVVADLKKFKDIRYYTRWNTFLSSRPEYCKKYAGSEYALAIESGDFSGDVPDLEANVRYGFYQYTRTLLAQHEQAQELVKKRDFEELNKSINHIDIDLDTKWTDFYQRLEDQGVTKMLKNLTKLDILVAFQNHIKSVEQAMDQKARLEKSQRYRQERKAREAFVELLKQLREKGLIRAHTKWKQVVDHFANDPRFFAVCCNKAGSNPLELFWDITEDEYQKFKVQRELMVDVLTNHHIDTTKNFQCSWEEFSRLARDNITSANTITEERLRDIYEELKRDAQNHNLESSRHEDRDRYAAERRLRRAQDDLYYYIKHLEPRVELSATWDAVKQRIQNSTEYKEVPTEEARLYAFEKYIRRQKEHYRERHRGGDDRDDREGHASRSNGARDGGAQDSSSRDNGRRDIHALRGTDFGPRLEY